MFQAGAAEVMIEPQRAPGPEESMVTGLPAWPAATSRPCTVMLVPAASLTVAQGSSVRVAPSATVKLNGTR